MASYDVLLQAKQTALVKKAVPILHIINELSTMVPGQAVTADQLNLLINHAADSYTLMSHENQQILVDRKNRIVKDLPSDLRELRHTYEPDSAQLFGNDDELPQKLSTIRKGYYALKQQRKQPYYNSSKTDYDKQKHQTKNYQSQPQKPSWKRGVKRKHTK